mmetsp:Transcript_55068/g.158389  ORF Transcript_55068/g.158389 Transcript_55068/m.158389 type:complete len:220 (-) Transcript_55068:90-749(-)
MILLLVVLRLLLRWRPRRLRGSVSFGEGGHTAWHPRLLRVVVIALDVAQGLLRLPQVGLVLALRVPHLGQLADPLRTVRGPLGLARGQVRRHLGIPLPKLIQLTMGLDELVPQHRLLLAHTAHLCDVVRGLPGEECKLLPHGGDLAHHLRVLLGRRPALQFRMQLLQFVLQVPVGLHRRSRAQLSLQVGDLPMHLLGGLANGELLPQGERLALQGLVLL